MRPGNYSRWLPLLGRVQGRATGSLNAGARTASLPQWLHQVTSAPLLSQAIAYLGAGVLGWLSWSGNVLWLCALPLLLVLWSVSRSRLDAFAVAASYYLAASHGLLVGATEFFASPDGSRNWLIGLAIWIGPSLVMAAVWSLCWGKRWPALRAAVALLIVALPPVGLIGWANPLTAAGALFPGWGWAGFVLTLVGGCLLASTAKRNILASLTILALIANLTAPTVTPGQHVEGVETSFGHGAANGDDYNQMRRLQAAVMQASERATYGAMIVTPELVAGDWSLNGLWWDQVSGELAKKGQTALIGARRTFAGTGRYENGLYSIGKSAGEAYVSRVPVPIGMWRWWDSVSAIANPFGSGTMAIGNTRIGVGICYEQLLVFPMLATFLERPSMLVGIANTWWAASTNIPGIQRQVISAWGRLFGVPVAFSANT